MAENLSLKSATMQHRRMLCFAVCWLILALSACTSMAKKYEEFSRENLDDTTVVEFAESSCMGTCPAFKMTIYGSGIVNFAGDRFSCVQGNASRKMRPDEVHRLVEEMIFMADFWTIKNFTDIMRTDYPTRYISFKYHNKVHKVQHYEADFNAPIKLEMLENQLNDLAINLGFIGKYLKDGLVCKKPDGEEFIIPQNGQLIRK